MEVVVAESSWHLSTNQLFELLKKAKEDSSAAAVRRLRLMMHDFLDADCKIRVIFYVTSSLAERLNTPLSNKGCSSDLFMAFSQIQPLKCRSMHIVP